MGVYKRCQEGLGSGGKPSTWGILETTVHVEAFQLKNFPICQTELCLLTLPGFSIKLAVLEPRCKKKSFTKNWAFTGHYGHLAKSFECNSKSLIMNFFICFLTGNISQHSKQITFVPDTIQFNSNRDTVGCWQWVSILIERHLPLRVLIKLLVTK